ncbi:hypothetical protein ACHQM5_029156 [Ranunculus cassubicifolius]
MAVTATLRASKWESRDIFMAIVVFSIHVLSLFAPFTFTWPAFWVAFILYVLTAGFGVSLCFHRNLTHRSFKLPKYLEYLFAYFGLHALQGDVFYWVSTHRYHHKVSDTERDPHSPLEGFWFSYMGWVFDLNKSTNKGVSYSNIQDLLSQPYYRFLEKTHVLQAYLLVVLLYMLGGIPFVVWGMGVRTVMSYHALFLVNSIGHKWGRRAWNTGDLSTNNWYMALFTFGDGWHNNHHAFEWSARHGLEWWEIDLTWYFIKLLAYLGLATEIKTPSKIHKKKISFNHENGDIKTM